MGSTLPTYGSAMAPDGAVTLLEQSACPEHEVRYLGTGVLLLHMDGTRALFGLSKLVEVVCRVLDR
jgi:hypothetical protein